MILFLCSCTQKTYTEKAYIKGTDIVYVSGKTGFSKKAPCPKGDFDRSLKDVTGDGCNEVLLCSENSLYIYDFSGIPIQIKKLESVDLKAKKSDGGAVIFLPGGQNFFVSGDFGSLSFSPPYNILVSQNKISYKTKLGITEFEITESYYDKKYMISEIIY